LSEGGPEIHRPSVRFSSEKTPVVCPTKIRSSSDGKSGSRRDVVDLAPVAYWWFVWSPPRHASGVVPFGI
jgi:hypothetical protein